MLRRQKRSAEPKILDSSVEKPRELVALGDAPPDNAEEVLRLERAILGADKEVTAEFSKPDESESRSADERKPAWCDEDDGKQSFKIHGGYQHDRLRDLKGQQMDADTYKSLLEDEFEKVSGATPKWARLKKRANESEESGSLLKETGDFLQPSSRLPAGTIEMKKCSDLNKASPAKTRLKSVEFHPTSQVALAASLDHRLTLFQVDGEKNPLIQSIFVQHFPIQCAHFNSDGSEVILTSKKKNFYYYDLISGRVVDVPHIKELEEQELRRFVVSPDASLMAFHGSYGAIHLLSQKSKESLFSLRMNGTMRALAFTPDGQQLLSHGGDGEVYIWDIRERRCLHRFTDEGCINGLSLAVSDDARYLATGSDSGVVNIYNRDSLTNSRTPKPRKSIMNLTMACTNLKFHPSTELLAASSNMQENGLKLIHIPSFTVFSNFPARDEKLRDPLCLDFSVNGGYMALSNQIGQALLYRVKHYDSY